MPLCHCATELEHTASHRFTSCCWGGKFCDWTIAVYNWPLEYHTGSTVAFNNTWSLADNTLISNVYLRSACTPRNDWWSEIVNDRVNSVLAPLGGGAVYTRVKDNNTDNKKRKHKGGSGLRTVPPRGNASRRFWVWRGRSEHAVGSLSSCI